MKRLQLFALRPPHHPRAVYVMAINDGEWPCTLGITVWESDPPQPVVWVGTCQGSFTPTSPSVPAPSQPQDVVGRVIDDPQLEPETPEQRAAALQWFNTSFPDRPIDPPKCDCLNPANECDVRRPNCRVAHRIEAARPTNSAEWTNGRHWAAVRNGAKAKPVGPCGAALVDTYKASEYLTDSAEWYIKDEPPGLKRFYRSPCPPETCMCPSVHVCPAFARFPGDTCDCRFICRCVQNSY